MSIACASGAPTPTSTPQENAWYACTYLIEQQLGLSMSNAQVCARKCGDSSKLNEYKVDVYYASNATTYECDVLHTSTGNWQLLGLLAR